MILETDRLLLREFRDDDDDALASFYADAEVMRWIGDGSTRPRDETARHIAHWQQQQHERGYSLWATTLRETGELVGRCGLSDRVVDGEAGLEVAWLIGSPFWRRGYASEAARGIRDWAFGLPDIPRLIALIRPENRGSIRVAQLAGMRHWKDTDLQSGRVHVFAIDRPHGA